MVAPAPFSSPLAVALAEDVVARLVRYARVHTTSDPDAPADRCPSTPVQLDLSRLLVEELRGIGLQDAELDAQGYVYATLEPAVEGPVPTIGLIAHVDTSPDAPGEGVEPLVHRGYDGGVLELPRGGTVLDPARMPELARRVGHDLVTSSGDTLLGADDKAGVAEILAAVAHLAAHPELPRPRLRIGFTPDEEIGRGAHRFDLGRFGAICAYTIDGSEPGELQDETFTAAEARIVIEGHDVHPGFATGKLVNATRLAAEVVAALPRDLTPEATSGRDGFVHVHDVRASAARAEIRAIVRDFDDALLARHGELVRRVVEEVVGREPRARAEVTITPQYPNMRTFVEAFPQVTAAAEAAIRAEGLEPLRTAIRGGTDGSQLSAMGLPTPNLFTGGHEYHSVREWASVQEMAAAAATIVRLAGVWAGEGFRDADR
ncbi:peptidase T [Patulibacter brassicae]|uniref:Peptidase T n=1 Tax=Patulibacter brassicae TaxID=1705717 RepID=A0ABU4VFN1_9ACTN|nr:peptidase T [Patulibacter brassicae]MDX8150225.1 peptidase T [Patulibacter brassicae]